MEEGGNIATTSLWKVGGNLKGTIDYIENEEKTKIPIDSLETTLNYAENSNKTEKQLYVTGINCNVDSTHVIWGISVCSGLPSCRVRGPCRRRSR